MGTTARRPSGKELLGELWQRIQLHQLSDAAASSAFWGLFAVFPFLFFAVSLVATVFASGQIEGVLDLITVFAPDVVRAVLRSYVERVLAGPRGADALVALLVSLWSASGGAVSVGDALNRAYGVSHDRRGFWKRRAEAVVTVIVCALLGLVVTVVTVVTPWIINRLFTTMGLGERAALAWRILSWPVALLVAALAWAIAYRVLPDTRRPFRLFSAGALVGIPLWIAASYGFSFYVGHFARYSAVYGSLATAVVLLLWSYLSMFLLLLGGEMNALLTPDGAPQRPVS